VIDTSRLSGQEVPSTMERALDRLVSCSFGAGPKIVASEVAVEA